MDIFDSTLASVLYWVSTVGFAATALGATVLTIVLKRNAFISVAAVLLAVGLITVALPSPEPPLIVSLLLGIASFALAVLGGSPAASFALDLATHGSVHPGAHGGIMVDRDSPTASAPREVLRGGLAIGYLERAAIAGALIAGFPEAIAIVVAIKGVGRFTELAEAETRERFMIGTLASIVWAAASAGLFVFALR
ncbi:hypothetical protein CLV49_2722 [Labedella gwakjiensis]|uniref:Uncharacterized protein n=1 Tax=Labedella gwakjiensis TaxID=390269 RepID=A0A2P8GYQ5_9MICO|nr:hypothetical protein [Labedella gwakjiensis]PSL39090.1 hypothetical protein CLV49_2722 [Labedella gwakjiensis]RUQ86463.1 hypothetical protein ELQ93_05615 [Labedella gwakjiensis]